MTSVGSVEIDISLNRSKLDRDLQSLENLKLEPIHLDVKLNGASLQRQIKDLTKDLDCIPLDLCVHINERRLHAEVEKVKEYLRQELELTVRAAVNASVKVETGAAKDNKNQNSASSSVVEAANQKLEASFQKVGDRLNAAIEKSLNSAFSAALSPIRGVARGFFEGIGQTFSKQLAKGAIASFQKELGINFKGTGNNIGKSAGRTTNEILGRKGKGDDSSASGLKSPTKPKPGAGGEDSPLEKELKNIEDTIRRVTKAFTQAGGGVGALGKSTTKAAEDALKLAGALVQLYGAINNTANAARAKPLAAKASGMEHPGLPASAGGNLQESNERGGSLREVSGGYAKSTSNPGTVKSSLSQKATESQPSSTGATSGKESKKSTAPSPLKAAQLEQTQNRTYVGFLKGDRASLTKEDAKNQVEAVRSQLEKQLSSLQATPQTEKTWKRIAALSKAIATIEARIASDIANPDIPTSVRQSLGQLKGASSKLAQTKRAIEAEAQKATRLLSRDSKGIIATAAVAQKKITDNAIKLDASLQTRTNNPRKLAEARRGKLPPADFLPGVVKGAGAAGAGASILGAGSAFAAAPGAGVGVSGFLGALPFDPTLGLAAGGLAASFFAAKKLPSLLRQAGAAKAASFLETDVGRLASDSVSGVFKQIRGNLNGLLPRVGAEVKTKVSQGLNSVTSFLGQTFNSKLVPGLVSGMGRLNAALETKLAPKLETGIRNLNSWIETKIVPKLWMGFENVGPKLSSRMRSFNNTIETKLAPKLESGIRSLNEFVATKVASKLLEGFDRLGPKLSSSFKNFNSKVENKLTPLLKEGISLLDGFIVGAAKQLMRLPSASRWGRSQAKRDGTASSHCIPEGTSGIAWKRRLQLLGAEDSSPHVGRLLAGGVLPASLSTVLNFLGNAFRSQPKLPPPQPRPSQQQGIFRGKNSSEKMPPLSIIPNGDILTPITFPDGTPKLLKPILELNQLLKLAGLEQLDVNKLRFLGKGLTGFAVGDGQIAYRVGNLVPRTRAEFEQRQISQNTAAAAGLAPKLIRQIAVNGKDISVMEQVFGDSLKSLAKAMRKSMGALNEDLLREVAAFAAKLHKAGVAHGDLHFGNLVKDKKTGTIKAVDFNDAALLDALSPEDRKKALAKDKDRLLRELKKAYKGKLPADQIEALFDSIYKEELAKAESYAPKGKRGHQRGGLFSARFFEQFFEALEQRFFNSKLFKGIDPKGRRSLTSEAAGFAFSGALMVAPGATLVTLLAPLATALTPLITTVGLVTQALAPLVGVITTTLKQIEPLQARLVYVSGSEAGAKESRNFVQGVAEKFNISSFASLEQFSKLSAAVKGTRLQGEPLKELFKGIAAASKALALDTQDLNLVMFAFTQIASKGKLSAEEVRLQLAERFPGIINLLAKALGLTVIEFNRMLESGQLLAADVLPKLGLALQQEYGAAAVAASGNFLSAITKIENAIFRLKEGVARSIAPIFTSVASTIGSSLNLIAQNAEKLVPIFSVVLIGVAAQFFVGLTQILEASGIIGKMQAFLIPLFSRLFVTLTPFMIGIVADFLDDILGAQTSVMDNMMKGVYNVVLGTILIVVDLAKAIGSLTSNIGKNNSGTSQPNIFGQIFDSLKNITKIIPSTLVEFASLSLILAQTYVLASQGLNLVLARFGTTVTALGASFIASARSGRLFNTALTTLRAGLTGSQLAAAGATAAFLLFFAKADFTNELGSDFDKLAGKMEESGEKIRKALAKTGDDLEKFPEKVSKLKSQGFDLTLGLGEVFGLGGAFRTDDLIDLANKETEKFYRDQRDKGLITEEEYRQNTSNPLRTLADKQFDDNKFKLEDLANSYFKVLDESGLRNGQFELGMLGKALDEVKAIDKQIGDLQKARVVLLGDNVVVSDNTKKEVAALDAQIQALLDRRGEVKKPIEEVRTEVLASADTLKSILDGINNAAIPEDKKQELRNMIQPVLSIAQQAKTKLEELGLIDLSPLGNSFADIVKSAEALNKALDKNKNRLTLGSLKEQTSIQLQLASGDIDRNNADRATLEQEIANLRNNAQDLESFVQERRKQLFELLAVPAPTPEQQDTITKYQSELTAKEVEFQQTQLSIAQKLVEARAKEIEKRLRQLDAAIKASEAALDGANTEKVLRIKLAQTNAPVTETGEALFDRLYGEQRVDEIDGRIDITRKKITDLDRNNFESEEKFIEAKAALQVELGNLIKQKIDERLNLERKLQEEVLRNIRIRGEAEAASLDRTKQLLESRRNLEKALSDAAIAPGESQIQALDLALDIRRKLDEATDSKTKSKLNELLGRLGASGDELSILQAKQRLEDETQKKKLQALEQEQRYELELLGIDHKRQRLAQEQAVYEADIANQRALIATLNSNKDLAEAKKSGDQDTIILAEKLLYINRQILDATAKQLDNANKNLEAQDEAASSAIAALDAQQQAARNSAIAAETLRNVQQDLTLLEVTNKGKGGGDNNKESTPSSERSPSQSKPYQFKSMLEASRFHLFGILPGESNLGASLRQQFGIGDKKLTEEQQGLLELSSGSLLLPGRGKNTSLIVRNGQIVDSESLQAKQENTSNAPRTSRSSTGGTISPPNQTSENGFSKLDDESDYDPATPLSEIRETIAKYVSEATMYLKGIYETLRIGFNLARRTAPVPVKIPTSPTGGVVVSTPELGNENNTSGAEFREEDSAPSNCKRRFQAIPEVPSGALDTLAPRLPRSSNCSERQWLEAVPSRFAWERPHLASTNQRGRQVGVTTGRAIPPRGSLQLGESAFLHQNSSLSKIDPFESTESYFSRSVGLQPDESAESYFHRYLGLQPGESAEDYFNRSVGLQPGESTEDYLKRPRMNYLGAPLSGSLSDLNLKYKPRYSNFEDLQQKHKPVAESFEELNQKYPNNTPGFSSFTDGLKEANKGIEQRLDALNEKMGKALASPRNLYVQSASPVSDAAQVWGDITRGMTTAAGLG